jgi:flagellar hook-associated protein 2
MSITPLRFTGISNFSEDFQQILNRAVSIAQLPVKQLQSDQAVILSKKQALSALSSGIDGVADAIRALGTLGTNRSMTATSTNTTRVSVQLTGAATASSYTITDITSVAKKASETMLAGLANTNAAAVDADGQLELVVGGTTRTIDVSAANTLEGLRDAINNSGAPVTATILNTGSGPTPYYLSLTAHTTGATTLQLRGTVGDAGSNLLSATNQGADAVFKLNGLAVTKADNLVTDVIPGVSFTILDKTGAGESVVLNLTSNRGSLATALQNLVTAYNEVATAVKGHVGDGAGALSGETILTQTLGALRRVTGYFAASGAVRSLADLGIEIDKTGVMSFQSSKFYALPNATIEAAYSFLGSSTAGFGALASGLDTLSDPAIGAIRAQQNALDATDKRLSRQVAQISGRIEVMQASLAVRLQQADVLLGRLQGQQSQLESLWKSLDYRGRNE